MQTGRYRVLEHVASGGMGEVYRGMMETVDGLRKEVALKLVRETHAHEPDFASLFVDEAKVAMTLSHANIVQAFDVGRIDQRWFLAMEYVQGTDLRALLDVVSARTPPLLARPDALFIVLEVLKGLDYAHRRKGLDGEPLHLVHRDISPSNVLISVEGEVKIADFGIAKSALHHKHSTAGTVKGKVPYLSPEQLRGQAVDARADLFAVGAMLYEMLTGMRLVPDRGLASIPMMLDRSFPRPRELHPEISEELDRIVWQALAEDPEARFQTAASMRESIEHVASASGMHLSSSGLLSLVRELQQQLAPSNGQQGFDELLGQAIEPTSSAHGFSEHRTSRRPVDESLSGSGSAQGPEPADRDVRPGRRGSRGILWLLAGVLLTVSILLFAREPHDGQAARAPVVSVRAKSLRQPLNKVSERPAEDERVTAKVREASPSQPMDTSAEATPDVVTEPPAAPRTRPRRARSRRKRTTERTPALARDSDPAISSTTDRTSPEVVTPSKLSVNTQPWSYVYVDGVRLRSTPLLGHSLEPGPHKLRFVNPARNIDRTIAIQVPAGHHKRLTLNLE